MADNVTDVPAGANPPSAEAHYAASRQPATTEAPKVEVVPEVPTVDMPKADEPKAEDEKAEAKAEDHPETDDDESEEDQKQDNEDEPHRPKRRSWKQENIRLTRKNRELREQLAAVSSGNQPTPPGSPPKTEQATVEAKRPKQEDFESYDAYVDAVVDWKADEKIKAHEAEKERRAKERALADEQDQAVTRFSESSEKAKGNHTDYEDAVWELGFHITPDIAQLIATAADNPGELSYHLSQNLSEAKRIAGLPLARAAIELGKIEARMTPAEQPKPKAIEKPKIPETKAPPPTKTVPQGTAKPARPLEQLSQQEFYARRKAELSR